MFFPTDTKKSFKILAAGA